MYSYAFLIASHLLVKRAVSNIHSVEYNDKTKNLIINRSTYLPLIEMSYIAVDKWYERYKVSQRLLEQEEKEKKIAIVALLTEMQLNPRAMIKKGKLICDSLEFTIDSKAKEFNYSYLMAARCLREGYSLVEKKGEYSIVVEPNGTYYSLVGRKCSCSDYERNKDCTHSRFAQVIAENRKLLKDHNLLRYV